MNTRSELDSYADTGVVGRNSLVTHVYQGRYVNISGFDPILGIVKGLDIVNVALAYDCPMMGQVVIFKINQDIYIKTMSKKIVVRNTT